MMVEIWRTLAEMHDEPPRCRNGEPRGEQILGAVSLAVGCVALCFLMALVC